MPTGTATLNFGAFPGAQHASLAIVGQASIAAGSLVEAEIRPTVTAEHSVDEHVHENLRIVACEITPGTGFNIRAFCTNGLLYGQYTCFWVWV